ncbi:MAG: hypothetical protein J2P17_35175, partial [Mycobacterium sp.]|nr:hypothetical protein [Mycobacterium sp.]
MTQPLPPNTITTLPAAGHPLQNTGGGTLHGDLGVEGTLYLNGNASVSQSLFVDTNSQNNGSNGAGVSLPGLYLGGGPGLTGEYIQSPRTSGSPNQYGIDFVLGWQPRVRINSGGDVSVSGRLTAAELHATGRYFGQGWDMGWPNNFGGNAIFGGVLQCQGRLVTNGYDSGWSNSLGGNVVISGDTIALAANGGIWWRWWGGAWHDFSHGVLTESDLYARGRLVTNNSDWGQNN